MLVKNGLVRPTGARPSPTGPRPTRAPTIFLVRKGNPKGIKDWDDLIRPASGDRAQPQDLRQRPLHLSGRLGLCPAKTGNDAGCPGFRAKLFANVPVLDGGGRGATTTFTQRGIGDVLMTFENEATLIDQEVGGDKFDVVYPSLSIEAEAPVAVVTRWWTSGAPARRPRPTSLPVLARAAGLQPERWATRCSTCR
jgi:sulfate transport system substrate-binding protein